MMMLFIALKNMMAWKTFTPIQIGRIRPFLIQVDFK